MVSVSQNSNSVGANEANKMPSHFPLPGYSNNIRVNATTCVNKQAPVHREASPDTHIYTVNTDENVPNPFSQTVFSHDNMRFASLKSTHTKKDSTITSCKQWKSLRKSLLNSGGAPHLTFLSALLYS